MKKLCQKEVQIHNQQKSKQNITRDIGVKNNLTIVREEGGGGSEERGLQELL